MSANIIAYNELRPPRLTFGVEMEFVMPWLFKGEKDPLESIKGLPPVFRMNKPSQPHLHDPETEVYDEIKALFEKYKLPTKVRTYTYKTEFAKKVLDRYHLWGVEHDVTVFEPSDEPAYNWVEDFEWVSVEVQSPVEPDIPRAFAVLNYVRQLLISTYRCRVNHSCGLHVHVGNGSERFPLDSMRRIASLVFATEPLIMTLNHPWRAANVNCRTLRDRSNLSRKIAGEKMTSGPDHKRPTRKHRDCIRYLATDVLHGEEPISWREEHREAKYIDAFEQLRSSGFEPFQPDSVEKTPSIHASDTSSSSSIQSSEPSPDSSPDSNPDSDVWESSEEETPKKGHQKHTPKKKIPKKTSSRRKLKKRKHQNQKNQQKKLRKEMREKERQANNLFNILNTPIRLRSLPRIITPRYTTEQLIEFHDRLKAFEADGLYFEGEGSNRVPDPGVFAAVQEIYRAPSTCTIAHLMYPDGPAIVNFQNYACDSFDRPDSGRTIEFRGAEGSLGPWVVTWAKICVGLVKFAIRSPPWMFTRVLENCQWADDEDGVYDCIDLLNDLGLYAEAVDAERRIAENQEEWGIQYVEPENRTSSSSSPSPSPNSSSSSSLGSSN
ncbi:hypothetical protein K445DRAFT_13165 [Daldinia sp. EC12]|nr:hypothetical protein K445DRAFT_13165 [Daldinia sp. EC12]